MIRSTLTSRGSLCLLMLVLASPLAVAQNRGRDTKEDTEAPVGGPRFLEPGQPAAVVHATVEDMDRFRKAHPNAPHGSTRTSTRIRELSYYGGSVGVETAPKIYLVFWGSQWINGDPSGEAATLEAFYNGVGGSAWANTVTQYCQGVAAGTVFCGSSGTPAANPVGVLTAYWYDNTSAAPSRPTAGITIVSGHEMAETMTDPFPSTGWLDSSGAEIADKCAWISSGQGASATITLSTGKFAVQSLWSNAFNSDSGGCVLSY